MDMAFAYPAYLDSILENLIKRNWIVHNFPVKDDKEIYHFANYRQNKHLHNATYTIHLDVNIYQYILNALKKSAPKQEFRDAIGLVAFCQIAEIELDPTLAVYEKINYRNEKPLLDEITSDLVLFHRINNTSNELLAKYSLDVIDSFSAIKGFEIDHLETQNNLTQYRRLIEWDSLYLMVLFIVNLSRNNTLTKAEKVHELVHWMMKEFRLSLVAIVFAILFFGKKPLKKMIKYKESDEPERRLKSLFNMTWDLYILNHYFRMWTERTSNDEAMYASHDKVFNAILRNAIAVQNNETLDHFEEHISIEDIRLITEIAIENKHSFNRAYDSEEWSHEYRAKLIQKYESLLGVNSSNQTEKPD